MARYTRTITKGSIFRDNVFSVLVVLLVAGMFVAWLRIHDTWQRAVTVTATTVGQQASPRGPLSVLQWQANGKTYTRAAEGAYTSVGAQIDVKYLPEQPERALTFLEVDAEPQRLIGLPALAGFVLIGLLKLWMIYFGPRRTDDAEVVAEVTEHD